MTRPESPHDFARGPVNDGDDTCIARTDNDVVRLKSLVTLREPVIRAERLHAVQVKVIGIRSIANQGEFVCCKPELIQMVTCNPRPHDLASAVDLIDHIIAELR